MRPMLRAPTLALTAVLTTALTLGAPLLAAPADAGGTADATAARPAARASTVQLTDTAGDVWVWSPGTSSWELWGMKEDADVLSATVKHGRGAVRVVMRFDNLRKKREAHYLAKIRTKKMTRLAWVDADSSDWGGSHRLTKPNGDAVPAGGLRHRIDYRNDTVVLRIPRRLLGSPAWVKVSMLNQMSSPTHDWQENPHNSSAEPTWTVKIPHA